jgi:Fumarylacetoacetase N-terminal
LLNFNVQPFELDFLLHACVVMLLSSLIDVPAHHHFSIHNLPYGVFSPSASAQRRIGVALGDKVSYLAL